MNHKIKFIVTFLIGLAALFHVKQAHATCSNYTDYADGQVLTASSLDSLQTNYTNCINGILDGDTFTGNMAYHAADAVIYSDTGSTLTIELDASDGSIIGAPQYNGAYGLTLSLSGGTLTVTCNNATCSDANPGYVVMNSTTAGQKVTLRVNTAYSIVDDAGTSDFTNLGFGITETANWGNDLPFFIYAVNRGNAAFDGSDGNSTFIIARAPNLSTTSSSGNDIGDTGAIPVNDSETVMIVLDDVTIANYTSLPTELIGAIRMQWSTTTDDWTIQTLGQTDGISNEALNKTFATEWTFPTGQNGADANQHNGGTNTPVFSNYSSAYWLNREGQIRLYFNMNGDGGTDGSGGSNFTVYIPNIISSPSGNLNPGFCDINATGQASMSIVEVTAGQVSLNFKAADRTAFIHSHFGNGLRTVSCTVIYQAF